MMQASSGTPLRLKEMVIYFGIGTNLGEREENLRKVIELLHERVGSA